MVFRLQHLTGPGIGLTGRSGLPLQEAPCLLPVHSNGGHYVGCVGIWRGIGLLCVNLGWS